MRLYAHNLLACLKCQAFPLQLGPECAIAPTGDDYDEDFTRRMLARVDYAILQSAYATLQQQHPALLQSHPIPATFDQIDPRNPEHIQQCFYALSAVAVRNGTLHCGQCSATYNIIDYIPVMLPQ